MQRQGKVSAINPKRGMVAIATADDGYTIIELLSEWNIEVGDTISWSNGYGMGRETYDNISKRSSAEVFVQNHAVTQANLSKQLLL